MYNEFLCDGPVLDVGCGMGDYLRRFPVGSTGIDISRPNLERCQRDGLCVTLADLNRHLPFAEDTFRTVFISHVLEHVDSPLALLREAARVAQRRVLVVLPIETSIARWALRDHYFRGHSTDLYSFSFNCLDRLFAVAGLTVERRVLDFPLTRHVAPDSLTRLLNAFPRHLTRWFAGNFWYVGDVEP